MATWLEVICSIILCSVVIVPLLCVWNNATRFYLRIVCYYFVLVICSGMSIPFALFTPGNPRNLMYPSWFFRYCFRWMYGLEWHVEHSHNLKVEGACIFVCNHQSAIDIQGMMCIWPLLNPCAPVMKRELLLSGPFGIICYLASSIFVDRVHTDRARAILNSKVQEHKKNQVNLWIFPEGTRNDNGSLLPFKKGAFHIAVQAQIPVVPIVFSSYADFYSVPRRMFNRGRVTVTVLPPVSTEGMTSKDVSRLADEVHHSMLTCFQNKPVDLPPQNQS